MFLNLFSWFCTLQTVVPPALPQHPAANRVPKYKGSTIISPLKADLKKMTLSSHSSFHCKSLTRTCLFSDLIQLSFFFLNHSLSFNYSSNCESNSLHLVSMWTAENTNIAVFLKWSLLFYLRFVGRIFERIPLCSTDTHTGFTAYSVMGNVPTISLQNDASMQKMQCCYFKTIS